MASTAAGNKQFGSKLKRGKGIAVGWLSEETVAFPAWWALGEVEEALLRGRARNPAPTESEQEERPCWWILSALDRCDGKEAREAYYDGL